MRVYHFVNLQYGLDDIWKRRLKVARFDQLNDPFEMMPLDRSDKERRRLIRHWSKAFGRDWGLLCFSRSWSNPVQWSHYADRHYGLCLGFDMEDGFLDEVHYQDKLYSKTFVLDDEDDNVDKALMRLMTTKFSHWSYEEEQRRLVDLKTCHMEGALHFTPFDDNLDLREIIVGCRADVTKRELKHALGDLKDRVTIQRARCAFKSFKMCKDRSWKG